VREVGDFVARIGSGAQTAAMVTGVLELAIPLSADDGLAEKCSPDV